MLLKRNEKIYFAWPEDSDEDEVESLRTDVECTFTSPIATQRSFRIAEAGHPAWNVFISPKARTKNFRSFGGLPSLVIDDEGYIDYYNGGFEFWWFEGNIYVLLFDDDVKLMKVTSENPKQDWEWLQETLTWECRMEDGR
jgi:hypothetical protein